MAKELDNLPERVLIALGEVTRFVVEILFAVDSNYDHVVRMAEVLVGADYAGHMEYGIMTLPKLLENVQHGHLDPLASPNVKESEDTAVALVMPENAFGVLAADVALRTACKLASRFGAGLATAHECLHGTAPSLHMLEAADSGYAVMMFMDTPPSVTPIRGKTAAVGANRIGLALPGMGDDRFVCDISLTNVAWEEVVRFSEGGFRLPGHWAMSVGGRAALSAGAALAGGALVPLGGSENKDGHKGYGLLLLVHCLCGVLGNSGLCGREGRQYSNEDHGEDHKESESGEALAAAAKAAALWQEKIKKRRRRDVSRGLLLEPRTYTFLAMDPSYMLPDTRKRTSELLYIVRHGQLQGMDHPAFGPWDLELDYMNRVSRMGGIVYRAEVVESLDKLAQDYAVRPLRRRASRPLEPAVDFLGAP